MVTSSACDHRALNGSGSPVSKLLKAATVRSNIVRTSSDMATGSAFNCATQAATIDFESAVIVVLECSLGAEPAGPKFGETGPGASGPSGLRRGTIADSRVQGIGPGDWTLEATSGEDKPADD